MSLDIVLLIGVVCLGVAIAPLAESVHSSVLLLRSKDASPSIAAPVNLPIRVKIVLGLLFFLCIIRIDLILEILHF